MYNNGIYSGMRKIVAFDGSTRNKSNTSVLLENFIQGAKKNRAGIEVIKLTDVNIEYCKGCLRCNLIKRCSISNDDWPEISKKIDEADILVFASPVYFHYFTAPVKKLIDRFRSFVHVQITETGLIHTPHKEWKKDFVLLMPMGSPDDEEARPMVELFDYMKNVLGKENKLHVITATRLALVNQINKSEEELISLYKKLNIPVSLAKDDFVANRSILEECEQLGFSLTESRD